MLPIANQEKQLPLETIQIKIIQRLSLLSPETSFSRRNFLRLIVAIMMKDKLIVQIEVIPGQ